MVYETKNYEHLLGLEGFSDDLMKNHFGLYNGYVANTNATAEKIAAAEPGSAEYAELSRRFGWEWNGMRLHELYFGGMTKETTELSNDSVLGQKIIRDFGSLEACHADFLAKGAMRGIGWVIMCHDTDADRLFNVWIGEHDMGHLAGATPLLVMDVFEHAFVLDYGTDRASYMQAFINAIDWDVVSGRLA